MRVTGMQAVSFAPTDADVFIAGLLGAVDVDDGPTDEQLAVLRAFAAHLWRRPGLDLGAVTPLRPHEVADAITAPEERMRFCEMAMTLELVVPLAHPTVTNPS